MGVLQSKDSNAYLFAQNQPTNECGICKYGIFVVPLRAFFGFGLRKSPKAAYEKTGCQQSAISNQPLAAFRTLISRPARVI